MAQAQDSAAGGSPMQSPVQQSPSQQQQSPQGSLDSISLHQLRRLAADLSRNEPLAYDYVYEDMGTLDEEIDEWFSYQIWQWVRLNYAQLHFEARWEAHVGRGDDAAWEAVDAAVRERFVADVLAGLAIRPQKDRLELIGILLYIVLGRWVATSAAVGPGSAAGTKRVPAARTVARQRQLDAMQSGTALVAKMGGIPIVWEALRKAFEPFWGPEDPQQLPSALFQDAQDELANLMTIMYTMMQTVLSNQFDLAAAHVKLVALEPSIPDFMMNAASRLRWDDSPVIPQCQVYLLLWKSLLLVFGGSKELQETKKATAESTADEDKEKNLIMASPLDYHAFRQEITSKYPAYIPPQPLLPLEDDSTTLLPPLANNPARNNGANGILSGPPSVHGGASILHQPVHIATPAPSPPPSPAVGKGGKKQNYQTNQNFPFMYPPLDATSNGVGGKGSAALQDALVGRKWEGSDVPSSILEAGELFSNRVRMTRATRQLWEERERFLKFERGWDSADEDLIEELDLSSLTLAEKEELGLIKPSEAQQGASKKDSTGVDYGPRKDELSERVKQRLEALESFYREALPHWQSLIIVLLKTILMNVAILMTQSPQGQQQHPAATGPSGRGSIAGQSGVDPTADLSPDEIDAARTREISVKAVSGILLLLLKWQKVSHVLKFEYLTQLLLDCNYVPLLLKLWAHQDVQQLIDSKTDRVESSFFYFCNIRAGAPEKEEDAEGADSHAAEEESEDDCAPPSIKRRRSPERADSVTDPAASSGSEGAWLRKPEVDELGYPIGEMPVEPITEFSRRNFFSLINLLRVMQKTCKNKAHRNLMLVHYKSSNILRKMLRVPQPALRLYTLKLFKNQVPYCGRKWRQGNMRVITAVYLHCRPELRDEWLAGSDVEAEVESSLPLEQALRSLTHWFNVRRYPDKMAAEVRMALREEHDFFVRELKQDLNWGDLADGESMMGEWEA